MRDEIADIVHPVASFALASFEKLLRGERLDMPHVQATLKGLLGGDGRTPFDDPEAEPKPRDDQAYLGFRFPLACWLDELFVMDSPWQTAWNARKLETALYGTNDRAWKFWEQARIADARLDGDELEVFLLCVALGFRGDLRENVARLQDWMSATQARLARRPSRSALTLSDTARVTALPPLRGAGRWPWRWLGAEAETSAHPEVDATWHEAVAALRHEGIDPQTTPLFLVLGRNIAGEAAFFDAAFPDDAEPLRVRNVPDRADAPLRVFANRRAIYVSCPAVGLLSREADRLAGAADAMAAPQPRAARELMTIGVAAMASANHRPVASPSAWGDLRRAHSPPSWPAWVIDEDIAEGRLRRLGQLLVRDRRPGAPLNGVLMLLPFAATERDDAAVRVGLACRRDRDVVRETTGLRCPTTALMCDMEAAPGFVEFVQKLPPEQRQNRLGQSARDGSSGAAECVRWTCQTLIPGYIREFWRVGGETGRDNIGLFRLGNLLRDRQHRLVTMFSACAEPSGSESGAATPGGCYLAATGFGPSRQAFVAGMVQKMLEYRGHVAWTESAMREDRTYRRWSWAAMMASAVLTASLGWLTLRML